MRLAELDYPLPEALIAQVPAPERAAARLLVLERGGGPLRHARIGDLPAFLPGGGRSRALSDRLRACAGRGGGANRGTPPDPGAARRHRGGGRPGRDPHAARRAGHVPPHPQRRPRTARDGARAERHPAADGGGDRRGARGGWTGGRGRHDDRAGARVGERGRRAPRRSRRGRALHPARPSLPGGGRTAHELPPAALDAPRAGGGVRRLGPHPRRLRRGGAPRLPFLQLRRRHAHHVSARFDFEVVRVDPSGARLGRLTTAHGVVDTPAFMPVATHGAVKGVAPEQLGALGATILLANAYHLAQRPGVETVQALGGLHALMGWDGPLLSDSGGFQVMSLGALVRVDDDGVHYRSHVDGRAGHLAPEDAIAVQEALGVDIAMSLDECVPAAAPRAQVARAVARTSGWAERGLAARTRAATALFATVQGGLDPALRAESARALTRLGFDGYAAGGLSVGEPPEETGRVAAATAALLPAARPRYLMGVGTPRDLLRFGAMGYDLFDCVLPTRNARNGTLFTRRGKLMIRNAAHARDARPVEDGCPCYTCTRFSRGALRHLVLAREMLGAQLATLHNLHFYLHLMREMRTALAEGRFPARAAAAAGAWA